MEYSAPCVSCGALHDGTFCPACGEERLPPGHLTLRRYLRDATEDLTSADGALWRSLRVLVARPGRLTREWLDGRRQPYVRPVRLFLIVNVAFFVTLTFAGGSVFRGQVASQTTADVYGAWARTTLDREIQQASVAPAVYEAAFDQHADTLSRTLIVLLVPLFASVVALLLGWRGGPAVGHLVFATHAITFTMVATVGLAVLMIPVVGVWTLLGGSANGLSLDPLIFVAMVVYFILATRRVYEVPWVVAVATGGLLGTVGVGVCVAAYQFVLFLLTVGTLSL